MPIEEVMRTQRALRRLKPDPVDDALVLRLIELALKAPMSRNAQNWEFVTSERLCGESPPRSFIPHRLEHLRPHRPASDRSDSKMQRQLEAVQ